jgi:hypothetical protein
VPRSAKLRRHCYRTENHDRSSSTCNHAPNLPCIKASVCLWHRVLPTQRKTVSEVIRLRIPSVSVCERRSGHTTSAPHLLPPETTKAKRLGSALQRVLWSTPPQLSSIFKTFRINQDGLSVLPLVEPIAKDLMMMIAPRRATTQSHHAEPPRRATLLTLEVSLGVRNIVSFFSQRHLLVHCCRRSTG